MRYFITAINGNNVYYHPKRNTVSIETYDKEIVNEAKKLYKKGRKRLMVKERNWSANSFYDLLINHGFMITAPAQIDSNGLAESVTDDLPDAPRLEIYHEAFGDLVNVTEEWYQNKEES